MSGLNSYETHQVAVYRADHGVAGGDIYVFTVVPRAVKEKYDAALPKLLRAFEDTGHFIGCVREKDGRFSYVFRMTSTKPQSPRAEVELKQDIIDCMSRLDNHGKAPPDSRVARIFHDLFERKVEIRKTTGIYFVTREERDKQQEEMRKLREQNQDLRKQVQQLKGCYQHKNEQLQFEINRLQSDIRQLSIETEQSGRHEEDQQHVRERQMWLNEKQRLQRSQQNMLNELCAVRIVSASHANTLLQKADKIDEQEQEIHKLKREVKQLKQVNALLGQNIAKRSKST